MLFTPAVYEHAAKLIGKTPWQVSRSAELLTQAHETAFRTYRHTPVVVGIDVYNLEPEAYGARVDEPEGFGIPAIREHPCPSVADVIRLKPLDPNTDGRLPVVIEAASRLKLLLPEADVRIPLSGPFSIASNLIGFDTLLMEVIVDPDATLAALHHLVEHEIAIARAAKAHGLGITLFESAATPPLISPEMFRDVELPALKKLIADCNHAMGVESACIIGGDTAPVLESLLETGVGYVICPSETDQHAFMEIMKQHPDVMVRVNMNPEIISRGNMPEVLAEADRVFAVAGTRKNVCLGTGVLPYETDPDVIHKMTAYIASLSV
ncbi:MAG TPA: uroporphyrinogen decarboxylase family protein [Bacteroidota bacterium]|nr:uroporphyrinogen decarboxylase family protein [Bacteroidota bacterium]